MFLKILDWFRKNQRPLPWRGQYDPYQVWVSEIMLQQTQVKSMLPYFQRFLEAFPNVQALAEAPEEKVLRLWEGLGYYSRARNLQKGAKVIVEKFGGQIPSNKADLLSLPGIGPYTAGAILSIAFNQDEPLVDGNVMRVLSRLTGDKAPVKENSKRFWSLAEKLLPKGQARDFNQGLMELGALICTPQNPKCGECPLRSECVAYKDGLTDVIPNMGKKTEKTRLQVACVVLEKEDKIFVQQRPPTGLYAGFWEFPGGKLEGSESPEEALLREIREELALELASATPLTVIKHSYTRYHVTLHCFRAQIQEEILQLNSASEGRWVTLEELESLPLLSANRKLLELLK